MDGKRAIQIEKIKAIIVGMIHYTDGLPKYNISDYLTEKLGYNYTYLSNLFSEPMVLPLKITFCCTK